MEIYALLRTERELKKSEANIQSYYMAESTRRQDEVGSVFWMVNRAGEMALYCRFRTPRVDPSRKILFGSSIDQAYSVKMAGYWPGFFVRFYRPRFGFKYKNANKKDWAIIQPSLPNKNG